MNEIRTFTREEIDRVIAQLKAIEVNGEQVFLVQQDRERLGSIPVQLKLPDTSVHWVFFNVDPSEPETDDVRETRISHSYE